MTNNRIQHFVDRVKRLVEEQKALGADITQVCKDAKGEGYEPTFIRFAARELLLDDAKRTERDQKREMYLNAVGLAVDLVRDHGLSLRQAEALTGASKSSIQRALAVPEASQDHREMVADDLGDPLLITNPFRARVRAIAASVSRPKALAASDTVIARAPDDTRTFDEITGPMPERLRRSAA